MSLASAVLNVAENMEKDANTWENSTLKLVISSYARELRSIVEATEVPFVDASIYCETCGRAGDNHESWCKRVKERKIDPSPKDGMGLSMVELVGGLAGEDNMTTFPIDPGWPVGAKTVIGTEIYILEQDGKLHYCEEETKKFLS